MNMLPMIAQGAEHAQPSIFSLNLGVSAWTVVIFLILLGILAKFAFPAILGYAEARERRIQEILDAAARDRAEAEQLVEEQRRELAAGRLEAQQMLTEAKQAAERVRDDLLARARTEQEEMLTRARNEIARERDRAVEQLRREAVEMALAAAGKLIGEHVDTEQDRALVRDYLERLDLGTGLKVA